MRCLYPVDRDTDEKMILPEETAPLLIDQVTIRLQRKRDFGAIYVVLLRKSNCFPKKLNSPKCRLSALKCDRVLPFSLMKQFPDRIFERLPGHHTERSDSPLFRFVAVETIPAVHVAVSRRRLHQDIMHLIPVNTAA